MSLGVYFKKLITRVEASEISNQGKDANGFFLPVRSELLRHLNLLHDLHAKPLAKEMVKGSWAFVVKNVPPEWLILSPAEKADLQKVLK
jgi:hypothetical protein